MALFEFFNSRFFWAIYKILALYRVTKITSHYMQLHGNVLRSTRIYEILYESVDTSCNCICALCMKLQLRGKD